MQFAALAGLGWASTETFSALIYLTNLSQREEDYSYFHLLHPSLARSTIFGISCNRQIQATDLLAKDKNVTRSTVQKAIVVLANKVRNTKMSCGSALADTLP